MAASGPADASRERRILLSWDWRETRIPGKGMEDARVASFVAGPDLPMCERVTSGPILGNREEVADSAS